MRLLKCLFPLIFALTSETNAEEIRSVERKDYAAELQGLVDFETLSGAPFPGIRYTARIPFRGLIADTYFSGQQPILRLNGSKTYGTNYGLPVNPLEVGNEWKSKSTLMALHAPDEEDDIFLTSRVYEPTIARRGSAVGFGAITLKFVDRQPVIGFDLEPLPAAPLGSPIVRVRFFSIDGEPLGEPIVLSAFGRYTFATIDYQQKIRGIEFVNFGATPFGIDHVVFVLPLVIG